ncbi:hypothetical protein LSAT2_024736 [Lamellibrachia satsuma]|nr:hypothetical protein LSAT2_024736 [Lamellibrachia satsuma]
MEAVIQAHDQGINALDFHDGRFYTASSDMTVKEWDLLGMTCVRTLLGHKGVINDFKVTKERMVSCSSDGNVRVWDFIDPTPKAAKDREGTSGINPANCGTPGSTQISQSVALHHSLLLSRFVLPDPTSIYQHVGLLPRSFAVNHMGRQQSSRTNWR